MLVLAEISSLISSEINYEKSALKSVSIIDIRTCDRSGLSSRAGRVGIYELGESYVDIVYAYIYL